MTYLAPPPSSIFPFADFHYCHNALHFQAFKGRPLVGLPRKWSIVKVETVTCQTADGDTSLYLPLLLKRLECKWNLAVMATISRIARINLAALVGWVSKVSILRTLCRCIFQKENGLFNQVCNDGPFLLEPPNRLFQIIYMRPYVPQASKTYMNDP